MKVSNSGAKSVVKCMGCGREPFLIPQAPKLCHHCLCSNFNRFLPHTEEVSSIASLNPEIPYNLLANVRLGNIHLLADC